MEKLSPADVLWLTQELREGRGTPVDARRLLVDVCARVSEGVQLDPGTLSYLAGAFESFLLEEKDLPGGLGLVRSKRGRPETDGTLVAVQVLRFRLQGDSLEEAATKINGKEQSQTRTIWAQYKHDALTVLRVTRALENSPFTPEEQKRLSKIYRA